PFEISGRVTGINKILCSSNGGINSVPIFFNKGTVIRSAKILIAKVVLRHFKTVRIIGSYTLSKNLFTGFAFVGLNFPFIKNEISTGASVRTSKASIIMMNVLVYATG